MPSNTYPNRPLRYILAFSAATFLLFRAQPFSLSHTFLNPRFYAAFLVSFIVGIIMVNAVHLIAVWCNTVDALKSSFPVRAMVQLVLGIAAPAILDLALISMYFVFYKENIVTNGFLARDFPFIALMLLILNSFYLIYDFFVKLKEKRAGSKFSLDFKDDSNFSADKYDEEEKKQVTDSMIVRFQNTQLRLSISQFLFVHRHERKSHILKMNGKEYPCQYTIAELAQILGKHGFAQLNRSTIINLKAVKGYRHGKRKNTLDLILNDNFSADLSRFLASELTVTNDYIESFQRQFSALQEEN